MDQSSNGSTAVGTLSNPLESDIRKQLLIIRTVDRKDQLMSLAAMSKKKEPVRDIWELDYSKFLEELKNTFAFDDTRQRAYGLSARARSARSSSFAAKQRTLRS